MAGITHAKVSIIADDPNYDIQPGDWNDEHVIAATIPNIATTATSDMILGAAGAWVKKTLAEVLSILAVGIASLTGKTTPVDADTILISDSAASNVAKKITWANIKATLKTYFDTLYYGLVNVTYLTSDFSKTSDTALANITGLSHTVVSAGVYRFKALLMTTCHTAGGVKAAVSGNATATAIGYLVDIMTATASSKEYNTALDGDFGLNGAQIKILIEGWINVNAGGTLTIQFAQNSSYGTPSTVYTGSWFEMERIA